MMLGGWLAKTICLALVQLAHLIPAALIADRSAGVGPLA
jgi:hypothetical protein